MRSIKETPMVAVGDYQINALPSADGTVLTITKQKELHQMVDAVVADS